MSRLDRARKKRFQEYAASHLDILYAKQNSLCYWCKSQTVLFRNIPSENVISNKGGVVRWHDGRHTFEARLATTDHVTPRRDNGTNDPENLVMACMDCNKNRTAQQPESIRRICPKCFGQKARNMKQCRACRINQAREWLASCGWVETPTNDEQSKFVDPETGVPHILRIACEIAGKRKEEFKP